MIEGRIHIRRIISRLLLRWIHDENGLITKANCEDYLAKEYDLLTNYDYASIFKQEDYESDLYASALLNHEITGAKPLDVFSCKDGSLTLNHATLQTVSSNENVYTIECTGKTLLESYEPISTQLINGQYVGAKLCITLDDVHNYLVFSVQKIADQGQPSIYIFDNADNVITEFIIDYSKIDYEEHLYVLDLTRIHGNVTIIFNGGCIAPEGSDNSKYIFNNICFL